MVPTLDELLCMKAFLACDRNATRAICQRFGLLLGEAIVQGEK